MKFLKESYNDKYVITYEKNGRQWFWIGVLNLQDAELYYKAEAEKELAKLIDEHKQEIKRIQNIIAQEGESRIYRYFIEDYQEFIDTAKIKKVNISMSLDNEISEKLIKSKSDKALQKNIETEIKAGKDPKQAAAIAYSIRDKAKKKDLKESKDEKVELEYSDLPINYQYNYYVDYWDGPQWDDEDIEIDWIYKVDKDSVKELLVDYVPDEVEEENIDKYLEDHFDDLFQKHEQEILDYYKDSAIRDAEENYEEEEPEPFRPDED